MKLQKRHNSSTLDPLWSLIFEQSNTTLKLKHLKCVSITCVEFFNLISKYIEKGYQFRIPLSEQVHYFLPQRVVVCVHSSIPTCATHVKYDIQISCKNCSKCQSQQPIPDNSIFVPPQITHLELEDSSYSLFFNSSSLTHLTYGESFSHPVDTLPPNITHLTFGREFNQPVDHLPPTLLHLKLGIAFDQPMDCLPPPLISLEFSATSHFNKPVNHLPNRLQILELKGHFNQSIDNLPDSLLNLTLSISFGKQITKLPYSLVELVLANISTYPAHENGLIIQTWPPNLHSLTLFWTYEYSFQGFSNLPTSLNHLYLRKRAGKHAIISPVLPSSLTSLDLGILTIADWKPPPLLKKFYYCCKELITVPPNLTSLVLFYNLSITEPLPRSITHLNFYFPFSLPMEFLPPSLTHLTVNAYSPTLPQINLLPLSLIYLCIRGTFDQPIDHLPPSLNTLHLMEANKFNQSVDSLPPSLSSLFLGAGFDQPIDHLPHSLSYLNLRNASAFSHSLTSLPSSLATLVIHRSVLSAKNVSLSNLPLFVSILTLNHFYQ